MGTAAGLAVGRAFLVSDAQPSSVAGNERQRSAPVAGQRLVFKLCTGIADELFDPDEHRRDSLPGVQSVAGGITGSVQGSGGDRICAGAGSKSCDYSGLSDWTNFVQQADWRDCRTVLLIQLGHYVVVDLCAVR